ncbi:hypothetical protein [Gimesia sp.]|uniref:hypothetical protein n=1 Tax=Gimesia sp. TaxID=2024833 RepID=UPI003A8DFA52
MEPFFIYTIAASYFAVQLVFCFLSMRDLKLVFNDWLNKSDDKNLGASKPTKDEALDTFDRMLSKIFWPSALRRLGLAAPLLGVVLTGLGFLILDAPGLDSSTLYAGDKIHFSEILLSLKPLYIGVFLGSLLALFNQFMMQLVDHRIGTLRLEAESKVNLDPMDPIWKEMDKFSGTLGAIRTHTENNFNDMLELTISSLDIVSQEVTNTAIKFEKILIEHEGIAGKLKNGAESFESKVSDAGENIETSITNITSELENISPELKNAVNDIAPTLESLKNATEGLDKSIKVLSEKVVEDLNASVQVTKKTAIDSAKMVNEIEKQFSAAAKHTEKATEELQTASNSLSSTTDGLDQGFTKLNELLSSINVGAENLVQTSKGLNTKERFLDSKLTKMNDLLAKLEAAISNIPEEIISAMRNHILENSGTASHSQEKRPNLFSGLFRRDNPKDNELKS